MLALAKDDSNAVKALLKNAPDREWDLVISEKQDECDAKIQERDEIQAEFQELQLKKQELQILLATHKDKDLVTPGDILAQQNLVNDLAQKESTLSAQIIEFSNDINELNSKIEKISVLQKQFPILQLKQKLSAQQDLERSLLDLQHRQQTENTLLVNQERSIKKLEEVPCGDKFPSCKFIKDSHRNKNLIAEQRKKAADLLTQITAAQSALDVLIDEDLVGKINKYDKVLQQGSDLRVQQSRRKVNLHELETQHATLSNNIVDAKQQLQDMKLRVADSDVNEELVLLKNEISRINLKVNTLDAERIASAESIGLLTSDIDKLVLEKEKYGSLLDQWKIYDLFIQAVSKKGIPRLIISAQLPLINSEIAKILQGVVGFTVELEADTSSNSMDIYINYGDSKRVIECASGMEKLVSSLAIRVALINISSLPKTDMLIIDEGFGALDEMNIHACSRLLSSLKKWFKNILVISHVDAVKDSVDNLLDITSSGKDSRVVYD